MLHPALPTLPPVPLFNHHAVSLPDYLAEHGGMIFRRWSDWIALKARQDFQGEVRFDHIDRLEDTSVRVDPPHVVRFREGPSPWDELKRFETRDSTGGQGYRGTVQHTGRFTRKLYINPHPANLCDFLIAFNKMVERENLPIVASKDHNNFDWTRTASGRAVRGVRHNGYCLYLADDSSVPVILDAVDRAARNSQAMLFAQRADNYPKAVVALGGRILMGLDLEGDQSFDNWTRPIGWAGFRAVQVYLQENAHASEEELKEASYKRMTQGLQEVRGMDIRPEQFLSFV